MSNTLREALIQKAHEEGFDICRITKADISHVVGDHLEIAISQNHHGTMQWMAETLERRKHPNAMWGDAKTAILLGMNYGPEADPLANLEAREKATISVYARNRDYHDIIKGKLKTLAGWFASKAKKDVKVFVDTAPLMEKPLAQQAGLGWQGKHTNLVSREFGSWLFLGSILTTAELETDLPEVDHCGNCTACLDICPTNAFPSAYQLDARRCISYLTIEHNGSIPHAFREQMGNRIYGCDDCLAVCPWNKFAEQTREMKLVARDDLNAPNLAELVQLDDVDFRKKFSGSPIKRIGRDKFIRNVLIAIGNSGSKELKPHVIEKLRDENFMVRAAAVWAISRLEDVGPLANMKQEAIRTETDKAVLEEWNAI